MERNEWTIKRTISVMLGKGSVNHNSRQFKAANIDAERTQFNSSYCNIPLKDVYHELFDGALERYNSKQKRADRCIDDYYEKIRSGKQEKLFYEVIFQIGNRENTASENEEGQLAASVLDEFMRSFQERNPHLKVFSAHLHMDEATPHLHIDFVPFATESKRGLDTRVSLKQALANLGFVGGTRGETEWSQWVKSEKEQLSQVMERHGIEWEQLGTHDEHLSVMDYKKVQRAKEVAVLEKTISKLQNKQLDVQAVEQIEVKNIPLSSKVMIDKKDYDSLVIAAQKYVVQVKKERKLEKLLQAAEKTIASLKDKVTELTGTILSLSRQLDQYRSIRSQLSMSALKQENEELRKSNSSFKAIIEQNGLGHLIGRKKEQRQERGVR
jgi:hypothetical protein